MPNWTSEEVWEKMSSGPFIIAEGGKGFIQTQEDQTVEKYLENAFRLVDAACDAGADAIKWQTHTLEDEQMNVMVVSPHFNGSDRYSWVKRNEDATPNEKFWKPLQVYCKEKGLFFFSTPMSRGAAQRIDAFGGTALWKVGSGDILDFVLLDYLRRSGKPIILSSGMSTLDELDQSVAFVTKKNPRVMVMHCVSQYPCPPEELRLGTIQLLKERYPGCCVGFSDHSIGVEAPLVAMALGATTVEKHFSLSRTLWGSDHKVSMLPEELRVLKEGAVDLFAHPETVRSHILETDFARAAQTTKEKVLQDTEAVFRPFFRKTLQAAYDIPKGVIITADMMYAMRPQMYNKGLPSERYEEVLGAQAVVDIKKFDPLNNSTVSL